MLLMERGTGERRLPHCKEASTVASKINTSGPLSSVSFPNQNSACLRE